MAGIVFRHSFFRTSLELAPHIEDRVAFGNPVMNFQNKGANGFVVSETYVELDRYVGPFRSQLAFGARNARIG